MGIKTERREIGTATYIVTQFGGLKGRSVLFRLSKIIGPIVAGGIAGGKDATDIERAMLQMVGSGIAGYVEHAKEEDFIYLCETFAAITKVEQRLESGESIKVQLGDVFDSHFAGKYGEMLLWLAFAVEVNFANFLGEIEKELTGALAKIGLRKKSKLQYPTE